MTNYTISGEFHSNDNLNRKDAAMMKNVFGLTVLACAAFTALAFAPKDMNIVSAMEKDCPLLMYFADQFRGSLLDAWNWILRLIESRNLDIRTFPLALYFFIVSLITFVVFGVDKLIARRGRGGSRVPESVLLVLALAGGSFAGLCGMYFFHHKTQKHKFMFLFPAIFYLQIMLALFLLKP